MSGAPSSSRRPQLIVRLPSRSSAQEPSSGSSYRPSRGETQVWASAATSSQHTDPQEGSAQHISNRVASIARGVRGEGSGNVRWTLNYSTTEGSRAEDNARIISELRREIDDLKKEARDRSPAKERPRNRVNLSQRKDPGYVPPTGPSTHVWVKSAATRGETASSIPRSCSSHSSE